MGGLSEAQVEEARKRTVEYLTRAGIVLTNEEKENIEVVDVGLGELEQTGVEIVTYVNTERCCAKELVLFQHQTCPEHRHPAVGGSPGKEESFRCRWGEVYLYVPGPAAESPKARPPEAMHTSLKMSHLTAFRPPSEGSWWRSPCVSRRGGVVHHWSPVGLPGSDAAHRLLL